MYNPEKNFSNSKVATDPLLDNLSKTKSTVPVRDIRVFLDNSVGEPLSKQVDGEEDLIQPFCELFKKITVDSITDNKLTLKLLLDGEQEEKINLINQQYSTVKPKTIENDRDAFSHNNFQSFKNGSECEAALKSQKSQKVSASTFISASTQTDEYPSSTKTQCNIINDAKIPQDKSEKVVLDACNHACCHSTSNKAQLMINFCLLQNEDQQENSKSEKIKVVFKPCNQQATSDTSQHLASFYFSQNDDAINNQSFYRNAETQTEDVETWSTLGSFKQCSDCPQESAQATSENENWTMPLNESSEIKESIDEKKFHKLIGGSVVFTELEMQETRNNGYEARYHSSDAFSDPEVEQPSHAKSIDQERISLYYESRLQQRKGKAKSKLLKWNSSSSHQYSISSPLEIFSEDKRFLEVSQPKMDEVLTKAQIEKGDFFADAMFISQARKTIPSIEISTFCCSILPGRKISHITRFPVNFNHFVRTKFLNIRSPRMATINPIFFTEITQYSANESVEHNKEHSVEVQKEASWIERTTDSEEQSNDVFNEYKEDTDDHQSPFVRSTCSFHESSIFNHSTAKRVIFYRKYGSLPSNQRGLSLCDSCFDMIQKAVKENSRKEISNGSCSKTTFGSKWSLPEEIDQESHYSRSREPSPGDEMVTEMPLTKRLKDECLNEHCTIVNNHLLKISNSDPNELNLSVRFLRWKWLEEVGNKNASIDVIRSFMVYFQAFSEDLFKMIIHTTDNLGNNVLHFAFSNNRFDIADLFLTNGHAKDLFTMKNKAGHTAFMVCSISHPQTEMDWFIVYKSVRQVDLNQASDNNGQTPLMNAARYGSDLMVKLLLDSGANPNIQDIDGSTALMYAAEYGREKCAKLLLNNSLCDPNIKDYDDETACSIALATGHKNVALLIYLITKNKSAFSSRCDLIDDSKNINKHRIMNFCQL